MDLKQAKKELDKDISEHVAGYQESKDIRDLTNQIETKKAQLNAKLSQDPDFHQMMEQKAGINQQIGDAKEILSSHVVLWKTSTGEDQVEYDEVMGKEVIVTGRLGKLQRYQTNIFSSEETRAKMNVTISDGTTEIHTNTQEMGEVAAKLKKRGRPPKAAE